MKQRECIGGEKLANFGRSARAILNSIGSGRRLRLREDAWKQLKDREWLFNRVDSDAIFLTHEFGAYGIAVRFDDIDWSGI